MKKFLSATLASVMCASMAYAQSTPGTNLVIEDTNGNKTVFSTADIAGVLFEEAPEYTEAPVLLTSVYTTNKDCGIYNVHFGTDEADENGDPTNVGEFQIALTLASDISDNMYEAQLPEGFYRPGVGTTKFTFDVTKSAIYERLEEGDQGIVSYMISGGSVDVRKNGDAYIIRMELTTLYGQTFNFIYEAPISFEPGSSAFEKLDFDLEMDIDKGQGRYYGNWYYPYADDITMHFYNGNFNENGAQIDGLWLNLDMYMPKSDTPATNRAIADGIYTVDKREQAQKGSYLPFTFRAGVVIDLWGTPVNSGTFVTLMEPNGRRYIALITDGTMTVSENGTKYDFDFKSAEGKSITGTWTGKPNVHNFYTEPRIDRPYSTVTEDHEFNFNGTDFIYFNDGETIKPGLNTSTLIIAEPNMKKGDYIWIDFLSEDDTLTDGVYTVNTDFVNHTILSGAVDLGGEIIFSWYADLSSADAEGVQQIVAPIAGGTFTVATEENGDKTITLDLVDDNGHKITGTHTAFLYDITHATNEAPAKKLVLKK